MSNYNIEAIRGDFPILKLEVHGKKLVYLDNSASAQKPQQVIDGIKKMYESEYANVHRGLHFLSNKATQAYEDAREKIAKFLGAPSSEQIIFTKGTTEAINLVAYGWAMQHMKQGDEIILSIAEHHSNIVPWHFLREHYGIKLTFINCNDNGIINEDEILAACNSKTKLIAIHHMSNVTGNIIDAKKICMEAKKLNIKTLIDGSQYAVHNKVDVTNIGCDFYCITGHKLYGPSGIGALYGEKDVLYSMRPFQGGGEMIENVSVDEVRYNNPPHRFEAGTPPIVQAVGLGLAIDYINNIGMENIAHHESEITNYAREKLSAIDSLRLIGDSQNKGAIFSFTLGEIHSHDVSMLIDREGIAVRAGTHCAQPLLERFGLTSTCRASFAMYNTLAEVDLLVASLQKAKEFFNG